MTVIEFFDRAALKNIASALLCKPDRVIMVGHDVKPIYASFGYFTPIMRRHGKDVEFIAKHAKRHDLQHIISVLEEIVAKYDDCVFDLTGGEDLYLVAVGAIMKTCEGRVQLQRFDFKNELLLDCDADGCVCAVESFDVSVDDMIEMHGGKVVNDPYDRYYKEPWILDGELCDDVAEMWEAMNMQTSCWNTTMTCIGDVCRRFVEADSLSVSFSLREAGASISPGERRHWFVPWIMTNLNNRGIINYFSINGDRVSFRFKNRNVKRIMTLAGQLLELRTAIALASVRDENGEPFYHDVRVGVVIDWEPDSGRDSEENRAVNEIDVVAMKGAIPVFISCKNGSFDHDELYKFNTVADLFGSEDVKKVLVTSDMERACNDPASLRERMDEMGIKRIENVHQKTDRALMRTLRGVWNNDI